MAKGCPKKKKKPWKVKSLKKTGRGAQNQGRREVKGNGQPQYSDRNLGKGEKLEEPGGPNRGNG